MIDDKKIANGAISDAKKLLTKVIKKGKIPQKDGDGIITILTKAINGQNLNAKEKQIAATYLRVKDNPKDAALYIIYPPGKGTQHIKIKVPNKSYDKLSQYGKQNIPADASQQQEPTKMSSPIPGKGMTALSINPKTIIYKLKRIKTHFNLVKDKK